jgi:hypothetical protein
MDIEQLKQEFLEEISAPIDMFLSENRQRMAGVMSAKGYNKVAVIKQVLTELERVIQHYKEAKLPMDYLTKVLGIIKPVLTIGKDTELLDIDKILVGIMQQLNVERGIPPWTDATDHSEDDILSLMDDLWETFKTFPTSDYELLKKAMNDEIDDSQKMSVHSKVIAAIRKDYNKETDPSLNDFINDSLQHIFRVLWDDEFHALALQDLQREREHESGKLRGVKESIRAAMLLKLMA